MMATTREEATEEYLFGSFAAGSKRRRTATEWRKLYPCAESMTAAHIEGQIVGEQRKEAEILARLRSESFNCNEPDSVRTGLEWADWLEKKSP